MITEPPRLRAILSSLLNQGSMSEPVVFHCDADAFFAACHVARDPSLNGQLLVVAGDPSTRHGIVLTASYPARAYGIRTAMPLYQALRHCPDLVVVLPDPALYRAMSRALRDIFDQYSPSVEPCSVDEAWIDMTGALWPWQGDPVAAALALQRQVRESLGITISIGISRNKMLAKQASDLQKPEGVTALWPESLSDLLWPRPLSELYGCGPMSAKRLEQMGLKTIGDVAQCEEKRLVQALGAPGRILHQRAWGADRTPIESPKPEDVQSIGAETTLPEDAEHVDQVQPVLLALSDVVATRLRLAERAGNVVTLKFKTVHFASHTRQMTLAVPTCHTQPIYQAAQALYRDRHSTEAVRLLGVSVSGFNCLPSQITFWDQRRDEALDQVVDQIRSRFGSEAIGPARILHRTLRLSGSSFEKPWRDGG